MLSNLYVQYHHPRHLSKAAFDTYLDEMSRADNAWASHLLEMDPQRHQDLLDVRGAYPWHVDPYKFYDTARRLTFGWDLPAPGETLVQQHTPLAVTQKRTYVGGLGPCQHPQYGWAGFSGSPVGVPIALEQDWLVLTTHPLSPFDTHSPPLTCVFNDLAVDDWVDVSPVVNDTHVFPSFLDVAYDLVTRRLLGLGFIWDSLGRDVLPEMGPTWWEGYQAYGPQKGVVHDDPWYLHFHSVVLAYRYLGEDQLIRFFAEADETAQRHFYRYWVTTTAWLASTAARLDVLKDRWNWAGVAVVLDDFNQQESLQTFLNEGLRNFQPSNGTVCRSP